MNQQTIISHERDAFKLTVEAGVLVPMRAVFNSAVMYCAKLSGWALTWPM
jgi:hypothetical protein